jgi:hypothetical protein
LEAYEAAVTAGSVGHPPGQDPTAPPLYINSRSVTVGGADFTDLLYMSLYPFNYGPKVLGLGKRYGDHVGDLEHVRLLIADDQIEYVYFGAHSGGKWKHRDECLILGDTLDVFVARGTHASYHRPGIHWRVPLVLKDDTSTRGFTWAPGIDDLLPTPDLPARIAPKVMDFKNQRWWSDLPPMTSSRSCRGAC